MRYGLKQIASELEATAMGRAYYGNALYVAMDIPGLSDEERATIARWLSGSQSGRDWRDLELIAYKLTCMEHEDKKENLF